MDIFKSYLALTMGKAITAFTSIISGFGTLEQVLHNETPTNMAIWTASNAVLYILTDSAQKYILERAPK